MLITKDSMIIGAIGIIKLMLREGIVFEGAIRIIRLMMEGPSTFEVGSSIGLRLEGENIRLKLQEKVFESAFCINNMRVVQHDQVEETFVKHIVGWARQGFSKIVAKCTFELVMQSPRLRAKAKCSINLNRISIGGTTKRVKEATATLK